jgi:putative hydrolase of the HAD superfamily
MSVPVEAVAFDLYGVMTPPPFAPLERHGAAIGLPPETLSAPFRTPRWFDDVQSGRLSGQDFVRELAANIRAAHDVTVDEQLVMDIIVDARDAAPVMIELVAELGKSYRTALLTNNIRRSMFWPRNMPNDLFDVIVDPDETGTRKPDPVVYEALNRALGTRPEEVVFVDDSARNLPPAQELGMRTVHFQGVAQCRQALRKLGVAVAE